MLRKSVAGCLVLCFLLAVDLPAQTGDWSGLLAVPSGTHVSVLGLRQRRSVVCTLVQVTDTELVCERSSLFRSRKLVFPRDEVREVRRAHGRAFKMAAGAAVGAAVGGGIVGIAAQSKDAETRVYGAIEGIIVGVIVGFVAGRISEHHGRVLYRR